MDRKSAEVTAKPADAPIVADSPAQPDAPRPDSLDGQLQVSRSALRFDSTIVGEESYLILRVTPPAPGTSVTVSTDTPDLFQVAVGVETLVFGPTLTFVPEAKGSYVHLRYWPQQTGSHRAVLTVQTQTETLTVGLAGRTLGMRGLVHRQGGRYRRPGRSGWVAKALVGAAVLGLAYTGYQYRCQLMPSLCVAQDQPAVTVTEKSTSAPVTPAPQLTAVRPKKTKAKLIKTRAVAATTAPTTATPSESVAPPKARQVTPEQAPAPQPVETPKPQQPVADQNAPKVSKKASGTIEKVAGRPVTAPQPAKQSSESELERVLNRTEN